MNHDDADSSLPPHILKRIDDAFNKVSREYSDSGNDGVKKKNARKIDIGTALDEPGGFLLDDSMDTGGGFFIEDSIDTGGGFLVEDEQEDETTSSIEESVSLPTHIPLSRIPEALSLLNLPTDDRDVLDVFRNASEGWSGNTGAAEEAETSAAGAREKFVSRADWRAVCSALLPSDGGIGQDENSIMEGDEFVDGDDTDVADLDGESSLSELSEDSDDEYREDDQPRKRVRLSSGKGKAKAKDSDFEEDKTTRTSKRKKGKSKGQKSSKSRREIEESSKEAFKLFFPNEEATTGSKKVCKDCGAPGHISLPHCRLTVEDVTRAMRTAGEAYTVDEVSERALRMSDN